MIWDDSGFLLSKNKYSENSIIAEVYTKNHGKISGIIFGGTSKKIKNYLQIGNSLFVNYNSKSEGRIGYFKIEIQQAFSPYYFDDQKSKFQTIKSSELDIGEDFFTARFEDYELGFQIILFDNEEKKKLVMSKYDYKNNKFLDHYVCTTILKPIS